MNTQDLQKLLWQEIVEKDLSELQKDARWFAIFTEFKDTYNSNVIVKQSSSVEKRAWIFVKWDWTTWNNDWAIHIDDRQAMELIVALNRFLKSE